MNVITTLKEKLDSNTFSTVIASLIWSAMSTLANNFDKLTAKEKSEIKEQLKLSRLIILEEIKPDLDMIFGTFNTAPELVPTIKNFNELDSKAQERAKRRGMTVASYNSRVKINNERALERHKEKMNYFKRHEADIREFAEKAFAMKPNPSFIYSAETSDAILTKAINKLESRYEDLLTRSANARGDYAQTVEEQLDALDVILDDLAA